MKKERAKQRRVKAVGLADIYVRLGEKDQAFAWLEKAYEQRHLMITILNRDPLWDNLRSDPRYSDLVRRMGLEP